MAIKVLKKDFYNTVLCQTFSPDGNILVVGDIFGSLSIYLLNKIINPESSLSKDELTPKYKILVKEDFQVNSLITTQTHLLVGGVGQVYAYTWKNIKSQKHTLGWTIDIPNKKDSLNQNDVNCMIYNDDNRQLFVACGNNVYIYDIESRKLLKTLEKHTDYIHSICSLNSDIISAGEDGMVNIWDLRKYKVVSHIQPSKNPKIQRNNLGHWIGAVSCNGDYILCGGGPRLSLWHYRFLTNSTIFPIDDAGIHIAEIYEDKIFAGGRCKLFYQMSFNGDIITEIPTACVTTYSAIHQEEPFKILSIAGSSPKIDICSNFMYKDQQLSLY